ncbi:MAG TPA: helix-turn-helix transcriptional regulator [Ktedonobacteraceae bacterium]|nr:helix-turn-helix transcriptional regulator [Ktedonobacteraceae bacterium]
MARPAKGVPPDTLGGRIRAARQSQHLSLSEVAGNRYSTSLISQIERNRVDPSMDSLHFLADQLKLPLDDLIVLARQHRETEAEAQRYRQCEDQRVLAVQFLEKNQVRAALDLLKVLNLARVPYSLRWRIAVLRGQAYFHFRQFLNAQKDLLYAITVLPEFIGSEHLMEAISLHLHLAATCRELGQLDDAFDEYTMALQLMTSHTPLHYIAEAHWGIALVSFEQADTKLHATQRHVSMGIALEHTRSAIALYKAIGEQMRAALLSCDIGLIKQALGHLDEAREDLQQVLDTCLPTFREFMHDQNHPTPRLKEAANVISAAACYLAGVELEASNYEAALEVARLAQEAAQYSYILRRAEAYMMQGRILETIDLYDTEAEQAFRLAISELNPTDRVAAKIHAHNLLGRHLLKRGKSIEGEEILDQALRLSKNSITFSSATRSAEDLPQDMIDL